MAYTETTTTGYGTRVGNSFKAIGSGFMLFLAGTALLWWNEGRAVKTEKMLEEAGNAYVEMTNPDKKDASLEGELICGTAMATTEDSLIDAQFGIGATAISIRRNVEYYQWVEHSQTKREDKLGGKEVTTTTYTYTKEWVSSPIQSSNFHDPAYQNKNTVLTTIDESEQWAENVKWGAYTLPESLIHRISSREGIDLAISEDLLDYRDANFFKNIEYAKVKEADKQSGKIECQGAEELIFSVKPLAKNYTQAFYLLDLNVSDGKVEFDLNTLSFNVDQGEGEFLRMNAEEWITDAKCLSKKGDLKRMNGKFRIKTIDLVNELKKEISEAINK